ncbi:hypothetical protein IM792_16150 [Mucilaginibacter sp. JRF]|uniref:hypothetical protein n=1 Tax=Mucilaginibacter sp. JRF TaxID=2780088 RepID=UPI00187F0E06|nr:hypothetical protein [Mucilaginibacter sp. JRF]MBE9585987.1 hypothetical protein [Mucilaginibacter sp. JRF]
MLKGKSATYLLIAAVATVWGLILYRVFGAMDDDQPVAHRVENTHKAPLDDYSVQRDTAKLLLNYRDPFGKSTSAKPVDSVTLRHKVNIAADEPQVVKPAVTWPSLTYGGYIQNPETRRLIALLYINGRNVMLAEGESAEGVLLVKNLRDSVRVRYQGKTRSFQQQNATP